jgi:tetratricopeptide (TPR) repeat protein
VFNTKELPLQVISLKQVLLAGIIIILSQLTGCFSDSLASPKLLTEKDSATSSKILVQQAIEKNVKGEYNEALNDLTKAVRLDNQAIDAYFNRGLTYYRLHKIEKAIEDFTTAISLNNQFIEAYVNRGNIYLELEEYSKAKTDYQRVLNINPDNSLALNNLGLVYMNLGEYKQATNYFKSAIERQPNYPDAYFNQGILYREIHEKEKAIANFRQAMNLAKKQDNPEIYQAAQEELENLQKPSK